jgi:hypothetical protein
LPDPVGAVRNKRLLCVRVGRFVHRQRPERSVVAPVLLENPGELGSRLVLGSWQRALQSGANAIHCAVLAQDAEFLLVLRLCECRHVHTHTGVRCVCPKEDPGLPCRVLRRVRERDEGRIGIACLVKRRWHRRIEYPGIHDFGGLRRIRIPVLDQGFAAFTEAVRIE